MSKKPFILGPGRRRLLLVVSGNKLLGAKVTPGSGSTLGLLEATVGAGATFAVAFFTDVFVLAFGVAAGAVAAGAVAAGASGAGAAAVTGAAASDFTFPVSSNSRKYPPDFLVLAAEPLS